LTLKGAANVHTRSILSLGRLMVTLQPAGPFWDVVPPGHSALSKTPPLLLLTVNVNNWLPQQTPACAEQDPPEHVSAPLHPRPSLQPEPLGSAAVQLSAASLHDSLQLPSPSGPGHGLPACPEHAPPEQVSAPLQNVPSLQADPLGSLAVQLSAASLHDSLQSPSPSAPGHGFVPCTEQAPPEQVSLPLQKRPSVQAEPLGSLAVQLSAASLHDSLQLPSPSGPGHGFVPCTEQAPPEQVSLPLQKTPSLHGTVLFGCAHVPLPLHWSLVQTLPSSGQAVPEDAWFARHVPDALQVSGSVQAVSSGDPQAVPLGTFGCVHEPALLQISLVQSLPSVVQPLPEVSWLSWHRPLPLHVSGLVQSVSAGLPQVVPVTSWFDRHVPEPLQVSGSVHSVSDGSPQVLPDVAWFARQVPEPLQVSGLVQSVSEGSPHDTPEVSKFGTHAPVPSQLSALLHSVSVGSPQLAPPGSWLDRHVPPLSQVSGLVHSVSD